jgi:hypothetical protein
LQHEDSAHPRLAAAASVAARRRYGGLRLPNLASLSLTTTTGSGSVPISTVRRLLMGHVDPVRLAHQILPHDDLPAVVRYNSAPYRPTLDLSSHKIIYRAEDVLFVGLTYVGFDGPWQNIVEEKSRERFFSPTHL